MCPACAARAGRRWGGGRYDMGCLGCCVALVLSAHPSRTRAAGMLAVVERRGLVARERVLAEVRARLDASKRCG